MRRVIDDRFYGDVAKDITEIIKKIPRNEVSRHSYGTMRSDRKLIMSYILSKIDNIKFGRDMNTTGIGNNGCYEIICTSNPSEEQICGLIHLTNDMYGGTICWVSDYDNIRKMPSRTI